jgi:predicted nuclease of predicted toxin-antitoxin system
VKILCDQNVDHQYTETFQRSDWITIRTVADALSHDAPDTEVSTYAQEHEW